VQRYYVPPGKTIGLPDGVQQIDTKENQGPGGHEYEYVYKHPRIPDRIWIVYHSVEEGFDPRGWFVDEYTADDSCDCPDDEYME